MWFKWLVCLLCLCATAVFAGQPDYAYHKTISFRIEEHKGKYKLSSNTEISQTYLTDRSLKEEAWSLASPSTAPLEHIKVYHETKLIKDAVYIHPKITTREFLDDDRTVDIRVGEKLKIADEVLVTFSQSYIDIAYLPIQYVPNFNAIGSVRFEFEHPQNVRIEPDIYFPRGPIPYRLERPTAEQTILSFDSLTYLEPLPYFAFNEDLAMVQITIMADSEYVTPTSPESFVKWYGNQTPLQIALDSVSHEKYAGRLRSGDDTMMFADINSYIHDRIRYISDSRELHGVIPHNPDTILDREYGDCKDRAYLATAMAHDNHRQLWLAAISSEPQPPFRSVSYDMFNHVICAYDTDRGYRFFDPTAEYYPFGDIPSYLSDRLSLIIREDRPELLKTGVSDTVPSISFSIAGSMDSLSVLPVTIVLRRSAAAGARFFRNEQSNMTLNVALANIVSRYLSQIGLLSIQWQADDGDEVVLSGVADLSHFAAVTADRIYLPRSPFVFPAPDIMTRASDTLPLYFDTLLHVDFTLSMNAPGATVKQDSTILKGIPGVSFTSKIAQSTPDTITMKAEIERYPKWISGESRQPFMDFCQAYFAAKKNMFSIEVGTK